MEFFNFMNTVNLLELSFQRSNINCGWRSLHKNVDAVEESSLARIANDD
jgi:hypothetical protein